MDLMTAWLSRQNEPYCTVWQIESIKQAMFTNNLHYKDPEKERARDSFRSELSGSIS